MVLAYLFLFIPILLAGLVIGVSFLLLLFARAGTDAIRDVPYRDFLGPGGPDDPFTVRIPRQEYETMASRPHAQTRTVRVARAADDEQLPRPDERTGLPPAA
jgi:hypothetical protein